MYRKLAHDQFRVCHNCIKIHDAVQHTVVRNHATVKVVHDAEDQAHFEIRCFRGHQWSAEFRAKQGRRWCQQCPAVDRAERRQANQQRFAEENARVAAAQQAMFAQARTEMQDELPTQPHREAEELPAADA